MPLGETIDPAVIRQIEERQVLFSTNYRYEDQNRYLNSRNAWVRVISFVNKGGSAELSENFVLSGVASSHTDREGFKQYSGVNFTPGSNSNSFYKTTDDFGTRPRPGITSFNIKSKNSGGTIQVAEIGFVVWNEDDLDTIEQLYLRLGFEVMVEWGHTVYIDNNGDLQEYVDADYRTFFNNTVYENTVKNHISSNRIRTDYNADGFLGYITNFSWSFRQDGGYECSIKVISTGAVIESLLGSVGSSEKSKLPISDCYFSDFHTLYKLLKSLAIKVKFERSSSYTGFGFRAPTLQEEVRSAESINFSDLVNVETVQVAENADGSVSFYNVTSKIKISQLEAGKNLLNELQLEFGTGFFNPNRDPIFGITLVVNTPGFLEKGEKEDPAAFNVDPVFLPLRYCLALINTTIKRQNRRSSVIFDVKSREKFLTSRNLFVVKPLKTLLLERPDQSNVGVKELYYKDAYEVAKEIKHSNSKLEEKEILNIFVNLEVFVRNLDSLIESNPDDNNIDLFTFLTKVLEEINESVSYGIDLGITFDEDTGKFKIIDRGNLPGRSSTIEPKTIQISGTSTTVSSLSLTSKVTNKLGNQISIAAQTDPGSYPASVIKYREWNQDLTSRLRRIGASSTSGIENADNDIVTQDQIYEYFAKLKTQYEELNNNSIYDSQEWDSLSTYGQAITREGIDYDPNLPKGLIPIELSFTMEGIAGLKVLQSFKIPNRLLPKKYQNSYVGFIINGIEHTIENNRWFTQITAQMYLFRQPNNVTFRAIRPSRKPINRGPVAGVAVGGPSGGGAS